MRSNQMEEEVAERLEAQGTGIAERFDNVLTRVAGKTDGLATTLSAMNGTYNMTYAEQVIRQLVASDDMIFGSGVWFAPYKYPGGEKWFGPYFSKGDTGRIDLTMDYSNEEYNYPQFGWYKAAIQGPKDVFWDEPAYDPVTNTTMMSSSAPIRANGQVVGVVTVDIGMKELEDYIQGLKIGEHGYAFLVTQSGLYAASPDADANMKKKITESPDPKRQELGNKIMGLTEPAHFMTDAFGEDAYVVALPIAATGLHLVLVEHITKMSNDIQDVSKSVDSIARENNGVLTGTEKLREIGDATASDAAAITTTVQQQQDAQKDIASASQSLAQMAMELQQLIGHFSI